MIILAQYFDCTPALTSRRLVDANWKKQAYEVLVRPHNQSDKERIIQRQAREAKRDGPSGGKFHSQFMRAGVWSVGLKLSHVTLGLALSIALARGLGPTGYGIYSYIYALVTLLAIPATFGLPNLVVRETAKTLVHAQWGVMRGMWYWATLVSGCLATVLALVASGIAWLASDAFTTTQLATFAWGLLLVPLMALGNLRGAALRGLGKVLQGQIPEFVLRPGLLLGLLLLSMMVAPVDLTPVTAMALHVGAALIAFAAGGWMLHLYRPDAMRGTSPDLQRASPEWLRSALPLALVAGMQLINQQTDILMLGIFDTSDKVGIYRVVVQGATLIGFGLTAINMVVAPQFARLYTQGDRQALQRLVTFSARIILLITLLPVALYLFWGEPLLRIVFGSDYASGHVALAILTLGQLGNAAFGSVAFLLNMTGHERDTARGVTYAAALNVLLNMALIPSYGMEGAAFATGSSLVVWNLLLWRTAQKRLSISSLAFSIPQAASPK